MTYLYTDTAADFVRARLDEIAALPEASDMLGSADDSKNINALVEALLPEAVETVHLVAPAVLMEGIEIAYGEDDESPKPTSEVIDEGVLDIDFSEMTDTAVLRLAYFKCDDSDVTLDTTFAENSPQGRLQLNKYLRGTPEHPIIIEMADSKDCLPHYKYYTTTLPTDDLKYILCYFPKQYGATEDTEGTTTRYYYNVSSKLYFQVLSQLTGLVLQTYGQAESAQAFFAKAGTISSNE